MRNIERERERERERWVERIGREKEMASSLSPSLEFYKETKSDWLDLFFLHFFQLSKGIYYNTFYCCNF